MYLGSKLSELYAWRICEFPLPIPKLSKVHLMESKWKEID
jgi:hypothetical protein